MGMYRLILALLVAISHMGVKVYVFNPGVVAVISFLIISGYVMTALIKRHFPNIKQVPAFYLDRALRLQPQYLFYVVVSVLVLSLMAHPRVSNFGLIDAIENVAIFPLNFFMIEGVGPAVIPAAWSLGLECFFYLLIPFLLILQRRGIAFILSFVVFISAYMQIISSDYFGYRLLPGTLFMFLLGSYLHDKTRMAKAIVSATFLVTSVLFVATMVFGANNVPYNKEVLLGIMLGIPLVALTTRSRFSGVDKALGDLSYGVFLNHWLLYVVIARHLQHASHANQVLLALALSLVGAWFSYYWIERPAINLRHRLRQKQSRLKGVLANTSGAGA